MVTKDIHQQLGENLIKQKQEAIPRRRSKVMKEYWEKKRTLWQDELKANLQAQVTAHANRYYSYKNNLSDNDNPTPQQHAMLDQHRYNYEEAKRVRQDLMEQAKSGTNVPTDIKIETQIKRRKVGVA
jgi:polyhydroxyalkanoate synthesis regulator phasin